MSTALLRLRDIERRYGRFVALDGVGFEIAAGEKLAVIGPNGAGKTTLFNVINGQLAPDRGDVVFGGESIGGKSPHYIAHHGLGRTFQIAATFVSLTVRENVELALLARKRRALSLRRAAQAGVSAAASEVLALVGLSALATRLCGELAYADLKRVELAIALAGKPKLLLMDEPTAGMAIDERHMMMELIRTISAGQSLAVLFTEHDMDIVFGLADRVLVLDRGTVVTVGTPDAVRIDARVRTLYLGELPVRSAAAHA